MKKYFVFGCFHVPFHDEIIFEKILKMLSVVKPYGFVCLGDFLDVFSLGKWNADSLGLLRNWELDQEYEEGEKCMSMFMQALGTDCKEKKFVWGNHEDRYKRELLRGDRAKYGKALQSPTNGLKLLEKGFEVKEDWEEDYFQIGKMTLFHGLYTNEDASKKTTKELEVNNMFVHTHRFGSFLNGNRGGWNIGFLGDLDSDGFKYVHRGVRSKWCNGFAFLNVFDDGSFLVEPVQIFNKKFVYGGKQY